MKLSAPGQGSCDATWRASEYERSKRGQLDASQLSLAIVRAASGDKAAYRTIYSETYSKLLFIARDIVGDRQVAEEVLQDAFILVWLKAGLYDPARGSAIRWLATVVRYRAIDETRSISRRITACLEDASAIADDAPLPPIVLEKREQIALLERELDCLDEKHRQAIRMAYFDDLTYQQLAERVGVPQGTMKSWIRRGISKLRVAMAES